MSVIDIPYLDWFQCEITTPKRVLLVKLIEPPCTERYARWCERSEFLI